MKHNVRKRNFEGGKRAVSCMYTQDNSENIHPNRLSSSSSYVNQSHDAGRNHSLVASNSYCQSNNFTIQDNDTSWCSGQRPLSSISISQRKPPPVTQLNHLPKGGANKEDFKINNAFYRPL